MTESNASKKRTGRAPQSRARKSARMHLVPGNVAEPQSTVCHACNSLPVGSVELASLMIVLVFSLSAVLLTSVAALRIQSHKLGQLEASVTSVSVNQ